MAHTLRGSDRIPHMTGLSVQRTEAGEGEVVVTCQEAACGCDWRTVRPNRPGVAESAAQAHSMMFWKGML